MDVPRQARYLKTLFFLSFVGLGIGSPFAGIFYKHVIVNPDGTPAIGLIGLIFFVMPLVSLIAGIPAGIFADKFQAGKHLISVLCAGVALFAILVGLAGEGFAGRWGMNERFLFIFAVLVCLHFCLSPINPMIDAETLLFLNTHSRREYYGVYRLWGTYGWSVSTILTGALLFRFRHDSLIFYGLALAYALLGAAARSGITVRPAGQPIIIPWTYLKKDRLFQWFLLFMFLVGVVSNASYIYIGYFFDDVMQTPLEIGAVLGTWTIFEVPVMLYSRRLIELFGNRWLIVSGLLVNGVRLLIFSLFTREMPFVWKWAAALLQGPGFGLTHLGAIDFVDRQAHPSMRATYLGILNVARMSLASALGGILGSWLIKQWGGAFLMQFCGWGSIGLIFFFAFLMRQRDGQGEGSRS
ncbi:MAG: MFS transporter [Syntrophales bacterium]